MAFRVSLGSHSPRSLKAHSPAKISRQQIRFFCLIGLAYRSIKYTDGCIPDVGTGAIASYERDYRVVRDYQTVLFYFYYIAMTGTVLRFRQLLYLLILFEIFTSKSCVS